MILSEHLWPKLAEWLGIEDQEVIACTITLRVNEVARVTLEKFLEKGKPETVTREFCVVPCESEGAIEPGEPNK